MEQWNIVKTPPETKVSHKGTPGTGFHVQLVGVTGDGIQSEITDVIFPVLTVTNELYVIDTTNSQSGSTLLVDKTKENIISLSILLKPDFKVDFVWEGMTTLASTIVCTPLRVFLSTWFFNLWHIPMCRCY
jgi:hypothetical protein